MKKSHDKKSCNKCETKNYTQVNLWQFFTEIREEKKKKKRACNTLSSWLAFFRQCRKFFMRFFQQNERKFRESPNLIQLKLTWTWIGIFFVGFGSSAIFFSCTLRLACDYWIETLSFVLTAENGIEKVNYSISNDFRTLSKRRRFNKRKKYSWKIFYSDSKDSLSNSEWMTHSVWLSRKCVSTLAALLLRKKRQWKENNKNKKIIPPFTETQASTCWVFCDTENLNGHKFSKLHLKSDLLSLDCRLIPPWR